MRSSAKPATADRHEGGTLNAPTIRLAKIAAFLVGTYWSFRCAVSHWHVGPIFGIVVLVWRAKSLSDIFNIRSIAFLAASTLIYALVIEIMGRTSNRISSDLWSYLAMAVGTILLPIAHGLFLNAPWSRVFLAVPAIYLVWYGLGFGLNAMDLHNQPVEALVNTVSIWQTVYLVFMFASIPGTHSGPAHGRNG